MLAGARDRSSGAGLLKDVAYDSSVSPVTPSGSSIPRNRSQAEYLSRSRPYAARVLALSPRSTRKWSTYVDISRPNASLATNVTVPSRAGPVQRARTSRPGTHLGAPLIASSTPRCVVQRSDLATVCVEPRRTQQDHTSCNDSDGSEKPRQRDGRARVGQGDDDALDLRSQDVDGSLGVIVRHTRGRVRRQRRDNERVRLRLRDISLRRRDIRHVLQRAGLR